ncbi:MAG TPA: EAL domain-containing protein [Burkholderiales bacterium]|jgi:diguanylate cyclase (GGDEF)-like protein/PAS domain S-box-containing protein
MHDQISILMVEDSKADAELTTRELKRAGVNCTIRRVDTSGDFRSALHAKKPDLILSDFTMPRFDGMSALALAWQLCPDVPFIFLSGTIGEEYAIRALKNGAADYVLKGNLIRLPSAVERAIADVKTRNEQKHIEALRALEHAISRELTYADGLTTMLRASLRTICEMSGWECGRFFLFDEAAGVLRFREGWSIDDPVAKRFLEVSRDVELAPGFGLPGRVLQSGESKWLAGAEQSREEAREALMPDLGMRSTFAVPVHADDKVIGVLSLSSQQAIEPDEGMAQTMGVVTSQVGHVTRRMLMEEEQQRFRAAMDTSIDMVALIDRSTMRYVDVNRTICELLGYSRGEMLTMGPADILPIGRAELESSYDEVIALQSGDSTFGIRSHFRCKNGNRLPFESTRCAIRSGESHVVVTVSRDIRKRLAQEEELRLTHERFNLAVHATKDVIWDWDLDRGTFWWNENLSQAFNYGADEVIPGVKGWYELIHPDDRERVLGSLNRFLQSSDHYWNENYRFRRRDGGYAFVYDRAHVARDDGGRALRMIGAKADATPLQEAEGRLAYLTQFDILTGLPNRQLFRDRLSQSLIQARRNEWPVAVLYVDLDRFKQINDAHGQGMGDRLLKEVGVRLTTCVRAGDTVGCFGGDEFAAILSDLPQPSDAGVIAQKILAAIATPFRIDGHDLFITASIGITIYPSDGDGEDVLLANADTAMHRAKEGGRNSYQFFTPEMNERNIKYIQVANALRHALPRQEFRLYYQPKASLPEGNICGFEALLRWQHPERGLVSPAEFIPILEETGMIVAVGEWTVREACRQVLEWKTLGLPPAPVAINLSARQFHEQGLEELIPRIVSEAAVEPALIQFEITESLLMNDPEKAALSLHKLRDSGFKLSVDDFGTGYSSLAYLKRFSLDALKIDQAFVRDISDNPDDAAIALAVISLAHSLELKVIAEGVESAAQLDFLRAHGCDEIQGYYLSRPLPAADATKLLTEGRRLPASGAGEGV